jgi:hypothetical protein
MITEADKELDKIKDSVNQALRSLSLIVIDRVPGSPYQADYQEALHKAMLMMIEVRDLVDGD